MKILIRLMLMTLVLPGVASAAESSGGGQQLLDRVVAVVNNEIITQSELDLFLRPFYQEFQKEFQGEELFKKIAEVRLKLLNQMIEDRLVLQVADKKEIKIEDSEIEDRLTQLKAQFKTEEEMELALQEQGLTLKTVRERILRQAKIQMLHDMEVRSKIVVSPLEVETYFKEHPEEFVEEERIRVRSFTIKKNEEARDKGLKDEKAWKMIEEARKKIMKGDDFDKLAKQLSQDMQAPQGGIGDWIEHGTMIPAIDDAIFKMKVGEISEIIETPLGYHFFRVEERKESRRFEFEEVREQVYQFLFKKKSDEYFKTWMEELKAQAYISVR